MTWAVHVSLAPTWFDPAETAGIITPFMFLYALHDALVKPMPGQPAWRRAWPSRGRVSPDGLTYEFVLRKGVRFHNGDPVTAEDVKFSFERYRGAASADLQGARRGRRDRRSAARALPPQAAVARLHDLLRHAGHRRRLDRAQEVRREGRRRRLQEGARRRRPVQVRLVHAGRRAGAGGVRAVLAQDPEREAAGLRVDARRVDAPGRCSSAARSTSRTRSAARSPRSCSARRGSRSSRTIHPGTFWLVFTEQWDPKSPWADRRVRLAANLAIDRQAINQAETLGFSKITGSIIPHDLRVLLAAAPARVRPAEGQAAPRRGRLPERLRRGRLLLRRLLRQPGRGRGQLPEGGGHPHAAPAARARGLHRAEQPTRSSRTSSRRPAARAATPPRGSTRSWPPAAPSRTAAIPTSRGWSASRRARWTPRSARRPCTGSSR